MKIYEFGDSGYPALLLLPGTFCHWKGNFGHVLPYLTPEFRVLCVSYDGFDETENTEFPTMLEETERIENWLLAHGYGHIRGAYGCSLGGSFVGLLAARGRIHMDRGILGSSDLDQASPLAAWLMARLMLPLVYPLVRDGEFSSRFLRRQMEKKRREMPEYLDAFLGMFGGARSYITQRSCRNQFCSDMVTPLPDHISVPGTEFHIFYATKMGPKYRQRYLRHFADPKIYEQDMQHEELLACHGEGWARLVKTILEAAD